MITGLLGLVDRGQRPLVLRYLISTTIYAISEGAVFGLFARLLIELLSGDTRAAAWWLIPLAGVVVIGWIAQYDMGMRALRLASEWRRSLYQRLEDHLVQLPLGWFDTDRSGSVPRLISGDVGRVVGSVFLAQALLGAVLTPVTVLVFLVIADWRIALAAGVCAPLVLLVFAVARRLTDRADAADAVASAEAGARLVEFAAAQPVLRSAGRLNTGKQLLDDALTDQHTAARRGVLAALPSQYLGQLSIQLAFTCVLLSGLLLLGHGGLTVPRMIALVVLGISLLRPFDIVAGVATALRAGRGSAQRISDVLETAPLAEPSSPVDPDGSSIELAEVAFGYPSGRRVLDGVSLQIPAGTTTALVGSSGAGKTTAAKLIGRFFDVESGAIRIGGVDVRELGSANLSANVAMVFQNVYLMDATIEENIRFGNPDATPEQVHDAARRAQVDSIIERLPDGWQTRVGEGGRLLSGGERQRVAIARALCKAAPIALLDEATSSLDAENEAAVTAALAELRADRTVLVIAHRLTTLTGADQIAVLDQGRIVELGRHDELLAANGRYATFWHEQQRATGWYLESTGHHPATS
ncbi:ABC transporter ATP-binding protein [Kribbella sp. NPDC055071]